MSTNITIDDTSPTFTYEPWGEGGLAGGSVGQGWATWYDALGYNNVNGKLPRGDSPQGTSYHVTAFDGATVSLMFHGTGLYLFGTSNCTYDVILDSKTTTMTILPGSTTENGVLASLGGLAQGDHSVLLRPHPVANSVQMFLLDRAVVEMDLGNNAAAVQPATINNQNTSLITYSPSGAWWSSSDNGVPSPFYQTGGVGNSATLQFTGPAVAVYGQLNWGHQLYNVSLDGAMTQYNGSSYWKIGETLLFAKSGLATGETHTIQLIDAFSTGNVSLTRFEVWQTPQTVFPPPPAPTVGGQNSSIPKKSGVSGGAIAGVIIAILAAVALAVGFFFWRRRRSGVMGSSRGNGIKLEIDSTPDTSLHNAMPYQYPAGGGADSAMSIMKSPHMGMGTWSPAITPSDAPVWTASEASQSQSEFPSYFQHNDAVATINYSTGYPAAPSTQPRYQPQTYYQTQPEPQRFSTASPTITGASILGEKRQGPNSASPGISSSQSHGSAAPSWPPSHPVSTVFPGPPPGAQAPMAVHPGGQMSSATPAPAAPGRPTATGYPLSSDAVNHILDQLVARMDPHAGPGGAEAPPPVYGGG